MMIKAKKAKYIYPLKYLEDGFQKIPIATRELVNASNVLLAQKAYAPALSLSIIALEECGKIFILDSLLFLRNKENNYFKKSSISHKDKLAALQFLIPLLLFISKYDKKYKDAKTKKRFKKAIHIGLDNLKLGNLKNLNRSIKEKNFFFKKLDISNFTELSHYIIKITKKYKIETIWHLAANSDIKDGFNDPDNDYKNTFFLIPKFLQIQKVNM